MGRTFEVLGGRKRMEPRAEAPAAIPFPQPDFEDNTPAPELVPVTVDDLPGDNGSVPFIEVGGPRAKPTPASAPAPDIDRTEADARAGCRKSCSTSSPTLRCPRSIHCLPDLVSYHRPEHPAARQFRRLPTASPGTYPGRAGDGLRGVRQERGAAVANLAVTLSRWNRPRGRDRGRAAKARRPSDSARRRCRDSRELPSRMVLLAMAYTAQR